MAAAPDARSIELTQGACIEPHEDRTSDSDRGYFPFASDQRGPRFLRVMTRLPLALTAAVLLLTAGPLTLLSRAHTPGEEMVDAARTLIAALDEGQRGRASFAFPDAERVNWHFIPRDRRGLPWKDMTPAQRHLATALLSAGLSPRGLAKATTIMSLEQILKELEQ